MAQQIEVYESAFAIDARSIQATENLAINLKLPLGEGGSMVVTKCTLAISALLLLGSCGFTKHQVVSNSCALSPGGRILSCKADCPASKKVTGGGWSADEVIVTLEAPDINRGRVVTDAPMDPPVSWVVGFEPHPRATGRLKVWAICANVDT